MSEFREWKSDDGRIRLINADCLAVLPSLANCEFGLVCTDPPYGNNYSTGRRSGVVRSSTKITGDIVTAPLLNDTAAAIAPLLNDTAAAYFFAAPDRLDMVLPIMRRWNVVNVLCWDKANCSAGDLKCSYGKQWEAVVFAVVSKSPLVGGRDRDVVRISRGSTAVYSHPTQKPVALISYLINRHPPCRVLDPFMGSGTAAEACMRSGREFVGIELEPRYFDVAVERCKKVQSELQQSLFAEAS